MITSTEISVFHPNSRKKELEITSVIPKNAVNALAERLGVEVGKQAEKALKTMKRDNIDLLQIRLDDRRIRIRQVA